MRTFNIYYQIICCEMKAFKRAHWLLLTCLLITLATKLTYAQPIEQFHDIALKNNPQLKAAYLEFESGLQRVPQVSSLDAPRLTMSAFGRMIETRVGSQDARIILSQMFPWFGTLGAKKSVAQLQTEALFNTYLDMRAQLMLEVSNNYYELYAIEKGIAFENENLALLEEIKQLAMVKYKSGQISMVDIIKIDLMINESKANIALQLEEQSSVLADFGQLLGDNQPSMPSFSLSFDDMSIELAPINPSFDQHPAIQSWDSQAKAATANTIVAKKSGLPNLEIGVDYSVISRRMDENPVGNGQNALMPMIGLSLPIYRKQYHGMVKEASLMKESAQLQRQQTTNQLVARHAMAKANLQKSKIQQKLFAQQSTTTAEAISLLKVQYATSTANLEDILMLEQELIRYKRSMLDAEIQALKVSAEIAYLTYSADEPQKDR